MTAKTEPKLTCDACLQGRPWGCKGPGCARWKTTTVTRVRKKPRRTPRPAPDAPRRKPGRPRGSRNLKVTRTAKPPRDPHAQRGPRIPHELAHAIAEDLLTTADGRHRIAARHGVTYEQVRTVSRNLDALNVSGLSGPKREIVELTLESTRLAVVDQHEVGIYLTPRML